MKRGLMYGLCLVGTLYLLWLAATHFDDIKTYGYGHESHDHY